MTRLAGQVALVTHAATGISAGIARRFAAEGAGVIIHHHLEADNAARVVADITWRGGRAAAVAADLTRWPDLRRLLADTTATFGKPDILVNTHGAGHHEADRFGAMLLCQETLRSFGSDGGAIITLKAAGAATDALTLGLSRAFGRHVRIHAVAEGTCSARLVELASSGGMMMKMSA